MPHLQVIRSTRKLCIISTFTSLSNFETNFTMKHVLQKNNKIKKILKYVSLNPKIWILFQITAFKKILVFYLLLITVTGRAKI